MLSPTVAAGDLITSAHINQLRDRTVQVFATAAERTSQWSAAPVGAYSFLADRPGVLWVCVAAGVWVPVGAPVASAEIEAGTVGAAAMTDVAGLAFTLTTVAGLWYAFRFRGVVLTSGAVGNCEVYLREGSTILATLWRGQLGGGGSAIVDTSSSSWQPAAGSHTYKLSTQSSGGTLIAVGAAAKPDSAVVELRAGTR